MSSANNYRSDSLRMTSDTTAEELQEFVRRRLRQPYVYDSTVVWNLSNHDIDNDALEEGIDGKFEEDLYLIPFSVTGTFGQIFHMLPKQIRVAEIQVYKESYGEYACYSNLLNDMEDGGSVFRSEMEDELEVTGIF